MSARKPRTPKRVPKPKPSITGEGPVWERIKKEAIPTKPPYIDPQFMDEWESAYAAGDLAVLHLALSELSRSGEIRVHLELDDDELPPPELVDEWQRAYKAGDRGVLRVALDRLKSQRYVPFAIPPWLIQALRQCVDESLKQRLASKTESRLGRVQARAEHFARCFEWMALRDQGLPPVQAYKAVAEKRGVSWSAIYQSCRTAKKIQKQYACEGQWEPEHWRALQLAYSALPPKTTV